jgi:hypothetical protein
MRRVGAGLVLAAGLGVLGACGGSGGDATIPTTAAGGGPSATAEPAEIVPDSVVTAGLAQVRLHAGKVAESLAAGDQNGAKEHAKEMYDAWYAFEATVRKNDKDLYLQIEDGLADIQAGARDNKADRVQRGTRDLDEGADAYLGKHP